MGKVDTFEAALTFDDFLDLLLRMAHAKFRRLPTISQRLVRLLKQHLLQPSAKRTRDPNDFREQLASSDAENIFERHKVVRVRVRVWSCVVCLLLGCDGVLCCIRIIVVNQRIQSIFTVKKRSVVRISARECSGHLICEFPGVLYRHSTDG